VEAEDAFIGPLASAFKARYASLGGRLVNEDGEIHNADVGRGERKGGGKEEEGGEGRWRAVFNLNHFDSSESAVEIRVWEARQL